MKKPGYLGVGSSPAFRPRRSPGRDCAPWPLQQLGLEMPEGNSRQAGCGCGSGGKPGGPIPPGERGASPCPSSRAAGTEQGPDSCSYCTKQGPNFALIAAKVLSLGYQMQPGNLSGMPGWKPPSKGNAANPVEERLAPASRGVTSRDSIPTPGSPSGSAGGEPGSQRAREDALRFGETLPCLLSPSGEARQNAGGKQGSEPCSIPRGPAGGEARERSGLSRRAALPQAGCAEPSLPDSPGGREELDRFFWLR